MIRKTDRSILEIALDNGFSSLSYFNRVFKKYTALSPTEYKKLTLESYIIE